MNFARVGGAAAANTAYHAGSKSLSYSPTAGNLIVYGAVVYGSPADQSGCTFKDSANNALTVYQYDLANYYYIFIGWEIAPSGITGVTATWGESGPIDCVFIDEFSVGGGTVSADGSIAGNWGTSGTTATVGSTVGAAGDLVYALCGYIATSTHTGEAAPTVGSGFTLNSGGAFLEDANDYYNPSAGAEYNANVSGAVTPTFGITLPTAGGTWWIASQAFKLSGGGGASGFPGMMLGL